MTTVGDRFPTIQNNIDIRGGASVNHVRKGRDGVAYSADSKVLADETRETYHKQFAVTKGLNNRVSAIENKHLRRFTRIGQAVATVFTFIADLFSAPVKAAANSFRHRKLADLAKQGFKSDIVGHGATVAQGRLGTVITAPGTADAVQNDKFVAKIRSIVKPLAKAIVGTEDASVAAKIKSELSLIINDPRVISALKTDTPREAFEVAIKNALLESVAHAKAEDVQAKLKAGTPVTEADLVNFENAVAEGFGITEANARTIVRAHIANGISSADDIETHLTSKLADIADTIAASSAGNLRRARDQLQAKLDELQAARERLVAIENRINSIGPGFRLALRALASGDASALSALGTGISFDEATALLQEKAALEARVTALTRTGPYSIMHIMTKKVLRAHAEVANATASAQLRIQETKALLENAVAYKGQATAGDYTTTQPVAVVPTAATTAIENLSRVNAENVRQVILTGAQKDDAALARVAVDLAKANVVPGINHGSVNAVTARVIWEHDTDGSANSENIHGRVANAYTFGLDALNKFANGETFFERDGTTVIDTRKLVERGLNYGNLAAARAAAVAPAPAPVSTASRVSTAARSVLSKVGSAAKTLGSWTWTAVKAVGSLLPPVMIHGAYKAYQADGAGNKARAFFHVA